MPIRTGIFIELSSHLSVTPRAPSNRGDERPSTPAHASSRFVRRRLLRVTLFVHQVAAEAVDIIGKTNPSRCASSEDMAVRLNPRWVVISACVDNLHTGKTIQGHAKAGAASRAECVVQQPTMIRRTIGVCARRALEGDRLGKKNQFNRERTTRSALAHWAMTNSSFDGSPCGAKSYRAALAATFMNFVRICH